jgi:protein-tyrosine-phosphatase
MSGAPAAGPRSILFCCTLNAVRSPMAEGLAKAMLPASVYVDSAGLSTQTLDGFAIAAMQELGIDIRDHNTQSFDDIRADEFELIVALSPEAFGRAKELARAFAVDVVHWPIGDPTGEGGTREQRMQAYRAVRDTIRNEIRRHFVKPPPG